jgi:hypothetical protein
MVGEASMFDETNVSQGNSEESADKKRSYTRPMLIKIGTTKDIVQSYYVYNPNDGYARYYVWRS